MVLPGFSDVASRAGALRDAGGDDPRGRRRARADPPGGTDHHGPAAPCSRSWSPASLADGWIEPLPLPAPPPAIAAIDAVPADAVVWNSRSAPSRTPRPCTGRWPMAIAWRTATAATTPPHYTVLGLALADGRTEALAALEIDRDLAIVVARRRRATLADAVARRCRRLARSTPSTSIVFRVPGQPPTPFPPAPGRPLPVRAIVASVGRDAEFIADGRFGTVWTTTPALQAGGEQLTVDLGAPRLVSALELASASARSPIRAVLGIEVSDDGAAGGRCGTAMRRRPRLRGRPGRTGRRAAAVRRSRRRPRALRAAHPAAGTATAAVGRRRARRAWRGRGRLARAGSRRWWR